MSVVQFWRERLAAKRPLYSEGWQAKTDYKPRYKDPNNPWPHSVCRTVLYQDYLYWHEDRFVKPYVGVAFFEASPDSVPKPADELTFYVTMAPWLYLLGKDIQQRSYLVPYRIMYEGAWRQGKKRRYFVRLCYWETHVAAFEMYTGVPIAGNVKFFEVEKTKQMVEEVNNFRVKIAEVAPSAQGVDT